MLTYYYIVLGLLLWCGALTVIVLGLYWYSRSTRAKIEELRNSAGAGPTSVSPTRPGPDRAEAAGNQYNPARHVAVRPAPATVAGPEVLQPPPTVRDASGRTVTVKDWLTHYWPDGPGWPAIVTEFYNRAAADPAIAEFFASTNMTALQKHFTHAMIIVTKDGVTVPIRDYMARVHAGLRNRAGQPISGAIYDRTINVLVQVLVDANIPDDAINELARTVTPLREAIVQEAAA
jgi:hypothetical protein